MTLFVVGALLLLALSRRRCRVDGAQSRSHLASSEPNLRTAKIGDVAFDYARAVLELDDITEATKNRALRALERMILPLTGHFGFDEVTPELQAGVRAVLAADLDGDHRAAVHVWEDLLRWGRCRLPPPQRRLT
jgi:hypothetical protein